MKIIQLQLFSKNIAQQKDFYNRVLGFEIKSETNESVKIQFGKTEILFIENPTAKPYHIAFNIPSNKIEEALVWLKERVTILQHEGSEIQDFDTWKAKAIYFYDTDQNIVEFIARETIAENSDEEFSANSVLSVSEIGIPSSDNAKVHDFLVDNFGLAIYRGTRELFAAIGDEHGLFICIDNTKRKWFPTNEEAYASDFEIEFEVKSKRCRLKYNEEELVWEK